jgi:hypothetical protein
MEEALSRGDRRVRRRLSLRLCGAGLGFRLFPSARFIEQDDSLASGHHEPAKEVWAGLFRLSPCAFGCFHGSVSSSSRPCNGRLVRYEFMIFFASAVIHFRILNWTTPVRRWTLTLKTAAQSWFQKKLSQNYRTRPIIYTGAQFLFYILFLNFYFLIT